MAHLERKQLDGVTGEASALLSVGSSSLVMARGGSDGWWLCHDEGGSRSTVSLAVAPTDASGPWTVHPVTLDGLGERWTDAEALFRIDDRVFVLGSGFAAKRGRFDADRAFLARFRESETAPNLTVEPELLALGSVLNERLLDALGPVPLLRSDDPVTAVNIEGAAVVGDDLFLGLRWPVTSRGLPIAVSFVGAATVLAGAAWTASAVADLPARTHVLETDATPKRPEGIRGMSEAEGALHVLTGQTERDLAAGRVKSGRARHVIVVDGLDRPRWSISERQGFEGFRKIEGLAPRRAGGWLYALDDEDTVVVLLSGGPIES